MYKVREVAEKLGVTPPTVIDWIHKGQITAINIAIHPAAKPSWRISEEAVQEFIESRSSKPKPKPAPERIQRKRRKKDPEVVEYY